MNRVRLVSIAAGAWCLFAAPASHASELKKDERVILYPALGRAVSGGWEIEFHGLVHEPGRHPLMSKTLRRALGIDDDDLTVAEKAIFRERAGYFFVDNERDKELSLHVAGRTVSLGTSGANGHFEALAVFRAAELPEAHPRGTCLLLPASIPSRDGTRRELTLQVDLLADTGLSVISDIDDTIKVSDVRHKRALITNTFCRPFRSVPGMADMYQRWAKEGAQFHYLTASPWQLYVPLSDFSRSNGFPAGTFHMKEFRVKDSTFLSLVKAPEKYKPMVIEELFRKYPRRRYVLVGDSGEKDPEIYGEVARKHPAKIQRIFIRDATGEPAAAARYKKAFKDVASGVWQIFKHPGEIQWKPQGDKP